MSTALPTLPVRRCGSSDLVLPVLGLLWLRRGGRSRVSAVDERPVRGDR